MIASLQPIIKDWFLLCNQHLLVHSVDGIVFELPTNSTSELSYTPRVINYSKTTENFDIILAGKWSQLEQINTLIILYGSVSLVESSSVPHLRYTTTVSCQI